MTDSHHPAHTVTGSALLHALREAALFTKQDARRSLVPARRWFRWPLILLFTGLSIGWTAGAIAIPLNLYDPLPPPLLAWLLGITQALPLLFALRNPLLAWRLSVFGLLLGALVMRERYFWPWPVTAWLAFLVILFCVAAAYDRAVTVGAGLITFFLAIGPGVIIGGMPDWFGLILFGTVLIVLSFGDQVRGRWTAEHSLAEQAELRRQDLIAQTKLEERARIARELHDVVAHHMSVIAMQAEAAPYKIPELPDAARDTFVVVRDAARDALAETRRVVGLLRSDDEGYDRRPQPGLAVLDELVGSARKAGLSVSVSIVGMPRPLSAGVDLSAYRIVQESLSNARRYAPGAQAQVEIRYGAQKLHITVTDDGARTTPEESGGGHGLVGMRERATMLGGSLAAGPGPERGWQVAATLPYGDP